jgi:hypothetical protein
MRPESEDRMTSARYTVAIVVDPEFGERVADLVRRIVWIAGSGTLARVVANLRLPMPALSPYRVLRTDLIKRIEGREDEIPPPQPGDPPIGETVLFPFTLRVPYTMPPFSAVVPTPDTNGQFDLMGLPAGEDSVRKIKAVKPAAESVAEMMAEAQGGAGGYVRG